MRFHVKRKTNTVFKESFLEKILTVGTVSGLTSDSLIVLLSELGFYTKKNVLVFMENSEFAFDLYNKGFEHNKHVFSYLPETTSENNVPGFEEDSHRYRKESLLKSSSDLGIICFGTTLSFNEAVVPKSYKKRIKKLVLSVGAVTSREKLISFLDGLNYKRVNMVEKIDEYAFRGDLVDFFPSHLRNPIRVSFSFKEIENICVFDPVSQHPISQLKETVLKGVCDTQVVDNINFISYSKPAIHLFCEIREGIFSLVGSSKVSDVDLLFSVFSYEKDIGAKNNLFESKFWSFFEDIFYVSNNEKTPSFLKGVSFKRIFGCLEFGFWSKKEKILVICENDFFGAYSQSYRWQPKKAKTKTIVTSKNLSSIKLGDMIVHESFGIGLYRGPIEKPSLVGVREGVELEFKNNTKVFVSMDQLGLIHRYIGSGKKPALSALGSKKWKSEVRKAKESAREVVYDIFALYTEKTMKREFSYVKENDLDGVLASSFSFIETPDQKKAIKDVYGDMNREIPMDRLISGDVGFGKTEVAIRAMFKAYLSDKVSVLLCPTTILADQHFITCKERLSHLGVSISLLSRFKSKKEQLQTLFLLENGKIDILIGTHRLLSKDVKFVNVGLLVIDEEHRFGVNHKEKIRSFKNKIDVLTLTATPIPRTLQQALIGLRDLTTIKTPPVSRKPINTFVKYFSWPLVFSHIQKELNRKGQVYFLYNDTKSIPFVVKKTQDRFKGKIVVGASAKVKNKELEDIILAFFKGSIDILICTTIIESGLDVTNANTIIINNAQNFGLAQLYQIRGRVGRGKKQAHCLLLLPPGKLLEKDSYNRLKAVEQNTTLGSGYAISQKDLEIRGAGSLFGYKQSGHVSSVGFEMYCDLLKEEVKIKKDGGIKDCPVINVNTLTEIPKSYIRKESLRVDYYYQISKATKEEEIDIIINNLEIGFGVLPIETKTLTNVALLRINLTGTLIKKVEIFETEVKFLLKMVSVGFNLTGFLESIQNFNHHSLVNYRYEKCGQSGLNVLLKSFNVFPSLDLLFSFIKAIKGFI